MIFICMKNGTATSVISDKPEKVVILNYDADARGYHTISLGDQYVAATTPTVSINPERIRNIQKAFTKHYKEKERARTDLQGVRTEAGSDAATWNWPFPIESRRR